MRLTRISYHMAGTLCLIVGGVALVAAVAFAYDLFTHDHPNYRSSESPTCQAASDAIGLALRTWALDHHGQFPFNVSTNKGGTLELCARGSDGFDRNAWLHFQVASNELADPAVLVWRRDRKHKPARDFQSLGPENVTYRLRTGTNLTEDNTKDVLVVCPLDGIEVYCDGHWGVTAPIADNWRYATGFHQGMGQILVSLGGAALFIGLGSLIRHASKRATSSRSAKPSRDS